jgi:ubiquitin carboxyl-terminal hydrolase 34
VATKHWLDDCVSNLDRLTPEVFAEDHEFWEELPSVVEALLRRQ